MCVLALALAAGCGGGGGGGGGGSVGGGTSGGGGTGSQPSNGPNDFVLQSAYIARPILDEHGVLQQLVNASSLYELDPLTGLPLPGYPKPLTSGIDLGTLTAINFAQILDPVTPQVPLVPRNAAIVLQFSFPIAANTMHLDFGDPAAPGKLTPASPVQVRRADGSFVETRAKVDGNRLTLFAQTPTQAGWEASPLVFDTFGVAVEDPTGTLRIVMGDGVGPLQLLSTTGAALVPRLPDKLGSLDVPLPFNPGNAKLDPLALQTEDGAIHFNGFLPDLVSPRVVRPVGRSGTVFEATPTTITGELLVPAAVTAANGGLGEWAGALLEVTDSETQEVSRYVVTGNTEVVIDGNVLPVFEIDTSSGTVDPGVVGPGDAYTVTRTEFYEPIPPPLPVDPAALADITVDPANHPRDANDPQDLINHDLRFFVRMYDEAGVERTDVWNPAEDLFGPVKGKFGPIPPRTTLRLQFSEPMEPSSFRPYETCYVTESSVPKADPALRKQRIGRCVASTDLRTISFEPFLEDQFEPGASEFIGFGGTPTTLKLVLRSIPEPKQLAALADGASPAQKAQFVDLDTTGVLGLIDLGGRGLGLPAALLDTGNPNYFLLQATSPGRGAYPPAVDFAVGFQTEPSEDPDFGVVVHRFMGQAFSSIFTYPTGSVHDQVTKGVEYHDWPPEDTDLNGLVDRRYIYGPFLLDIGLNLPGRLTGAPANTVEHLIDDFNKPKPAPFSSPNGEDFLPSIGFGVGVPLNSPFGCRFQHVFRPGDASPSAVDFEGITLDLVGLAWAPIGNQVANETIEAMSILVGLSAVNNCKGPNTNQESGIPAQGGATGIQDQFDCNLLEYRLNCDLNGTNVPADLLPFVDGEPKLTEVVRAGTPYPISNARLFKPANALNQPAGQFNLYLDYPAFNAGVDPSFGKSDVHSFPYDSRFPMVVELHLEPAVETFPSNANFYRFSPALFSSVLPRFRIFSQGQHPLANCVPNTTLGCIPGTPPCGYRAGEGGPLIEPGSLQIPIPPPLHNNQMPTIPVSQYILPPKPDATTGSPGQPEPDADPGVTLDFGPPCILGAAPTCNTNPDMNWYFANGMQAFPLPNLTEFPGKTGAPPTKFYGYGVFGNQTGATIEPSYVCDPAHYGDNSRYYMMWKYRKRVSIIESPTVQASSGQFGLVYRHPVIDPPLSAVSPEAGLRVEFRASTQLDFATPQLDSGYLIPSDPSFSAGLSGSSFDRVFVKFKATFAVASGLLQPPSIDTIAIPFEKLEP